MKAIRHWNFSKIAPEARLRGKPAVAVQNAAACNLENRWCSLPDHLVETILLELQKLVLLEEGDAKALLPVCGVCTSWRRLARSLLFGTPWTSYHVICDPSQLFTLSPWPHNGGLMKCFVRREKLTRGLGNITGKLYRFTLWQGADASAKDARFLLCAVQHSKSSFSLHLDRNGSSTPIAYLRSNFMRTRYSFEPSQGCTWLQRVLAGNGYSTAAESSADEEDAPVDAAAIIAPPPPPPPAAAAAAAGLVPQLAAVKYKIRVRGMMMPRRMFIELPCPQQLHDHPTYPEVPPHVLGAHDAQAGLPFDDAADVAVQQQEEEDDAHDAADDADVDDGADFDGSEEADSDDDDDDEEEEEEVGWQQQQQQQQPQPLQQHALQLAAAGASSGNLYGRPGAYTPDSTLSGKSWAERPALRLQNKPPHWNEALRCWCLNFRSRVKLASVKNFQLQSCNDVTGRIVMQFGKVESDAFVLDLNPCVMTSAQAFAIALTSFETKLLL